MDKRSFIDGVLVTPLEIVEVDAGNVLHAMRASSPGFTGFGEAYFSSVVFKAVKAWKRHRQMTLNLVVPHGMVRFVIIDDRSKSPSFNSYQEVLLSPNSYARLTVPPMLWVGFEGLSKGYSLVMNIANLEHDSKEADLLPEDAFQFEWST